MMVNDDVLMERGYHRYPPEPDERFVTDRFQKRFDDKIGKKYFIDAIKYEAFVHPYTKEVSPPNYEFMVYFIDAKTEGAVRILLYAGWDDIEEVEKRVEQLFQTGLFAYYEKWEDV